MDDPLIWWRAVHFAATVMLAGVVFFVAFVATPAFSNAAKEARLPSLVASRLRLLAWISLLLTLLSGAAWLIVLAQQLSDGTMTAVLRDGIAWIVLTKTGFGATWAARFALAVVVGACLPIISTRSGNLARPTAVLAAAGLVGALGFAGHAAAGVGVTGIVHLAADIAHLIAAAAWVGALLPLAMLLHAAGRTADQASMAIGSMATQRFSMLGIASVATLMASGIVNTWVLAGSVQALLTTAYGLLLLAKVALFFAMVAVAAANRFILTPRLVQEFDIAARQEALRRLRHNCLTEAAIGAVIFVIVGLLGTLPPAAHDEVAAMARAAL